MDMLKVGDIILSANNRYSPVYSFGHLDRDASAVFYQFHIKGNNVSLEMTGSHLLCKEGKPVRADSIRVGDFLSSGQVTNISTVTKQGLYMPLTSDGTLVVDGCLVSCYVSIQDQAPEVVKTAYFYVGNEHNLLHWWLAPYRVFCLSSISGNLCHESASFNNEGILKWLASGARLAESLNELNSVIHHMLGFPLFIAFGLVVTTEIILGPHIAPYFFLLTAAAYFYKWKWPRTEKNEMKDTKLLV
jgi:hypothetical protein